MGLDLDRVGILRALLFTITQSLLAFMTIGAFIVLIVNGQEIPSEFALVLGAIVAFFYEGASSERRYGHNQNGQGQHE